MARLADRGFVRKVITNAQSTQFVMPSLFSQSYPLDHGGYNNGIRERPASYAESLHAAGFETHLMASCNQLGMTLGYDRGFDQVHTTNDYRLIIEQRINRTLSYDLGLWKSGARSEEETIAIVRREMDLLLERIEDEMRRHDKSIWPPKLRRINERVARGCAAERDLLRREPQQVLHRLMTIAPGIYWRFLGVRDINPVKRFFARAIESVSWRSRSFIQLITWFPYLPAGHYRAIAGEVIDRVSDFVEAAKDRQWFIHMHVMDVHDCRSISRPVHVLWLLHYLPRWAWARLRGKTNRRWVYDIAVMYVDDCLGKLFKTLERTGQLDDTVILVTGDHGLQYAESPRKKYAVGYRTHYEDLEVPLMLFGCDRQPSDQGMIDSMGVTATFLDALGVQPHASFKGKSVFCSGRDVVISENCGHGNADLARRDIYFTITSPSHKLMSVLRESSLKVEKLFDRRNDPRELCNLIDQPEQKPVIEGLLGHLFRERGEVLALRGITSKERANVVIVPTTAQTV
jgi:hypothetical protein